MLCRIAPLLFLVACGAMAPVPLDTPALQARPAPPHPLDSLTADELEAVPAILRASGKLKPGMLFPIVVLKEPPKAEALRYRPGALARREAFSVVLDRRARHTYEAVVDPRNQRLFAWNEIQNVQPAVLIEEFDSPKKIVAADPRFIAAMAKRGIADLSEVQIDTWAAGLLSADERASEARLLRCLFYLRSKGSRNPYFRPIEGVTATVDPSRGKVVDFVDSGVVPVVGEAGELDEASNGPLRKDLKPLRIIQPEGRSFTVEGQEVRWQKWRFRFAMHPREGVVIHNARYRDGDKVRSVLYRGSLSEMVVPYGDIDRNWVWRNAFDLGEYGVGRLADSLEVGLDAPENAAFFDSTFADDFGKPYVQPRTIAIYERDVGILWKHFDFETQHSETRRERQLVVKFVATIGNYDYGISWVFTQTGAILVETELTGIMLAKGVAAERSTGKSGEGPERFGRLVNANTVAVNHQHFFNFRLDLDVDGTANTVVEVNNRSLPSGGENVFGNAFFLEERRRKTEQEASSMLNMATQRFWRVISNREKNALGHPAAYQLVGGHNAIPFFSPGAEVRKRAGFTDHHFWATRYRLEETNAAGYFVNQNTGGDGLPKWIADNEPIEDEDVVIWYTFGVTHNPRPEEWPVMPSHRAGFLLQPDGFFARNPALDVPAK